MFRSLKSFLTTSTLLAFTQQPVHAAFVVGETRISSSPLEQCGFLLGRAQAAHISEHRVIATPLTPEGILFGATDQERFAPKDLRLIGRTDIPILRRTIRKTTY